MALKRQVIILADVDRPEWKVAATIFEGATQEKIRDVLWSSYLTIEQGAAQADENKETA